MSGEDKLQHELAVTENLISALYIITCELGAVSMSDYDKDIRDGVIGISDALRHQMERVTAAHERKAKQERTAAPQEH